MPRPLRSRQDIASKERFTLAACAFAIAAGFSLPAAAANRALLIGVSAYPNLAEDMQLDGPKNDVQLMRNLLQANGFAENDIRILAEEGANVAGLPTRSAILSELQSLASQTSKGDFVYLQFSGHGSQQPTRPGKATPEPDGLDEIILPRDAGKWEGEIGSVKNALVDEELGKAIGAIRAKGGFVWAVFDNCHAGNVTRGGSGVGDGYRERKARPDRLGIPQAAIEAAVTKAAQNASKTRGGANTPAKIGALGKEEGAKEGEGGYVYFYAAQPNETAPEKSLPAGHPDRIPLGVFTFTLAQVISANPGITYRQAGERVLQMYASQGTRTPTPNYEGSGLDAPLFGQKPGDAVRQWPIAQKDGVPQINAGALQQFGEGAVFAIHPNAAARNEQIIGYLRATRVGVANTQLAATEMNGKPALSATQIPAEAVARIVDPAINLGIKVALPGGKLAGPVGKALDSLRKTSMEGLKIEWLPANASAADLRLEIADNRLWLLPGDGSWIKTGEARTPSIVLDKPEAELKQIVAATLQKVAKVTNLGRLGAQTMGGTVGARLDIRYQIKRVAMNDWEEVPLGTIPTLKPKDRLRATLRNRHSQPIDVTVLGIDALYGIEALFPQGAEANRIHPNDMLSIPPEGEIMINGDEQNLTSGQESIIVIATEAPPQSASTNLAFLAQEGIKRERGGSGNTIEGLFSDAAAGTTKTRGPQRATALEKTSIQIFSYRAAEK